MRRSAALAGVDPRDVVFTSGGTEANNLALRSAFPRGVRAWRSRHEPSRASLRRRVVAEALEREGRARVRWLDVLADGTIDLIDSRTRACGRGAALVTVQAVNHETGVLQPVVGGDRARARCAARGCTSTPCKAGARSRVPSGWDTASMAPHKMRGPKGIGALARASGRADRSGPSGRLAGEGHPSRHCRCVAGGGLRRCGAARCGLGLTLGGAGGASRPHRARAPRARSAAWPRTRRRRLRAPRAACLEPDLAGLGGRRASSPRSISRASASRAVPACSAGTVEPSPVLLAMSVTLTPRVVFAVSIGDATTDEDASFAVRAFRAVLAR